MFRKLPKDEFGYSLVEVMASIIILAIAILPMFTMFDAGLTLVTRGGNHDKARALANQQLSTAKSLPYNTVRNTFPNNTCNLNAGDGNCDPVATPGDFSYTVAKQFVDDELLASTTDAGVIKITVTVSRSGESYPSVSGIVAR